MVSIGHVASCESFSEDEVVRSKIPYPSSRRKHLANSPKGVEQYN